MITGTYAVARVLLLATAILLGLAWWPMAIAAGHEII
jgi:hypothetical protein